VRVTERPRMLAVLWLLAWAAVGAALMLYRGLVVTEGPCAPGSPHCGMVLSHPLAPLGVFVWFVGLITGGIWWHFVADTTERRKKS
jgi:hypothetical protein